MEVKLSNKNDHMFKQACDCPFSLEGLTMEYQRQYSKWHNDSKEHRMSMIDFNRLLIGKYIKDIDRGPALDIGCGMGFTLEYLVNEGFNPVIGIDNDPGQINICLKNKLNATLSDNITSLLESSKKGSFNLITALDVLEHLPIRKAIMTLKEIHSLLSPTGLFICTVPNANSVLAGRFRYDDAGHFMSYGEHSLDYILYHGGFKKIKIYPADILSRPPLLCFNMQRWIRWFNFKACRAFRRWQLTAELGGEGKVIPLSPNLIGIAQKW